MDLPVNPPILPMLSKRIADIPAGGAWIFEPKWDGFRALVFRDGDEILIQSRDEKSLNRYFPELIEPIREQLPARCVLDGEIVVANSNGLDFEALQLRIHPAASRVRLLSQQSPASIVFFDLLCEGDRDLRREPFQSRRQELESLLSSGAPPIHLTPATCDSSVASDWFRRFEGAGLDGVMAKPISGPYEPGKRVMLKVKHERDCDCVVAGFRWHKNGERTAVGSLLLGLFDDSGASAARGRLRKLHSKQAPRPRGIPRALSSGGFGGSSLEVVGGAWNRNRPSRASDAGRPQPLEPRQGLIVGAVATRTGGGSCL